MEDQRQTRNRHREDERQTRNRHREHEKGMRNRHSEKLKAHEFIVNVFIFSFISDLSAFRHSEKLKAHEFRSEKDAHRSEMNEK